MPTAEQRRALRRILQVEAELEPIVLRALRRSARRTLRPLGLTASAQRPTPEDMRALVGFWHQEIDKLISPAMLKLFQKAAEDTMGLLPGALNLGNIGANIRDVRAAAWFGTVKNRLVGVGENMYQDVASSLRDSYAAGEGVDKQAARIRNVMGNEATANRAARIARTEGAAIVNGADHSVALELEQAGIVNKRKWLATEDARTRPTHAAADGQLVGINEPFLVGGSRLLYPSDPAGPPEEVIQCRCTTLLEVTEESTAAQSQQVQLAGRAFADEAQASSYIDKTQKYLSRQQSIKEVDAGRVIEYTSVGGDVNDGLRAGTALNSVDAEVVAGMDRVMVETYWPSDFVTYRGTVDDAVGTFAKMEPGTVFTDAGYSSTSLNPAVAQHYAEGGFIAQGEPVVFEIRVPKGTGRGIAVEGVLPRFGIDPGDAIPEEAELPFKRLNEVILPRGSRYTVVGKYQKDGTLFLQLEVK